VVCVGHGLVFVGRLGTGRSWDGRVVEEIEAVETNMDTC
jgi:hypothetical protein